jgi:hypothetical protein
MLINEITFHSLVPQGMKRDLVIWHTESKRISLLLKHVISSSGVNKNIATSKKNHGDCFWEHRSELRVDFLQISDTATDKCYCGLLARLQQAIRCKRPGFMCQNFYHYYDYASRPAPNWTSH